MAICFSETDVPSIRDAAGVKGITLAPGDYVVGVGEKVRKIGCQSSQSSSRSQVGEIDRCAAPVQIFGASTA